MAFDRYLSPDNDNAVDDGDNNDEDKLTCDNFTVKTNAS